MQFPLCVTSDSRKTRWINSVRAFFIHLAWDHPNSRESIACDPSRSAFHYKAEAPIAAFVAADWVFRQLPTKTRLWHIWLKLLRAAPRERWNPALQIGMWKWLESVWDAFVDPMYIHRVLYYFYREVYGNTIQHYYKTWKDVVWQIHNFSSVHREQFKVTAPNSSSKTASFHWLQKTWTSVPYLL